jgi:hypothetical protein
MFGTPEERAAIKAIRNARFQNLIDDFAKSAAAAGMTVEQYSRYIGELNSKPDVGLEGLETTDVKKRNGAPPCPNGKCKREEGGELPHAQFGIPSGFVDGMGMGQEGYDYGYSNIQLPAMDTPQYAYNPNQPISGASTSNLFAQKQFPTYSPNMNSNTVNTNKKTIVNGEQIAAQGLIGARATDFALGWFDDRSKTKAENRRNAFNLSSNNPSYVNNPLATHGNYTTNVQAGADFFQPNKHTPIQDYGTGYMRNSKYGGQQQFASGGEYKISHDQLLQLLRDGAEIEFL